MNKKILLTEKVKTLQDLTEFMKNIDSIEGASLMLDFMKVVKKNVLQIKTNDRETCSINEKTHEFEEIKSHVKAIEDLELLGDYFENIADELQKEYEELYEEDCIQMGNEFWKQLYSCECCDSWD